jgi:hypothetical protein
MHGPCAEVQLCSGSCVWLGDVLYLERKQVDGGQQAADSQASSTLTRIIVGMQCRGGWGERCGYKSWRRGGRGDEERELRLGVSVCKCCDVARVARRRRSRARRMQWINPNPSGG